MPQHVKICGIKTEAALDAALDGGADYVGLVHHAKSPRHVSIERAAELCRYARVRGNAKVVVLLVDPDDATVENVIRTVKPDVLQLHGDESRERIMAIRQTANTPIIKAVSVATAEDVAAAGQLRAPGIGAGILLFDAKPPKDADIPGGNGLAFDWRILTGDSMARPFALAGGLTADNVAAAIALTNADIVDVSSGVESARGVKDPELIRRFLTAAKTAKHG